MGRRVAPVLDARPRDSFLRGHAPLAAHLPRFDWDLRAGELPLKDLAFEVVGEDEPTGWACAELLQARGFVHARAAEAHTREDRSEKGPARAVLWQPASVLVRHEARLPRRGRALDIACGSGRNAAWLAARGLATWGVDVLPDALVRARALARGALELDSAAAMFPRAPMAFTCADATRPLPFAPRSFDLVTGFRYLERSLFSRVADLVVPGGFLAWETFSSRAPKDTHPRRAAFRLAPGELDSLCRAAGFEVERVDASEDGALDSVLARLPG